MLPYLLCFLAGGTVAASVAYLGSRGSNVLAAFAASLPVLFLLNVFLMYRSGGVNAGVAYAKGVLFFVPVFATYAILTIWLLPRIGMPKALLPGMPLYLLPLMLRRRLRSHASRAAHLREESADRPSE